MSGRMAEQLRDLLGFGVSKTLTGFSGADRQEPSVEPGCLVFSRPQPETLLRSHLLKDRFFPDFSQLCELQTGREACVPPVLLNHQLWEAGVGPGGGGSHGCVE